MGIFTKLFDGENANEKSKVGLTRFSTLEKPAYRSLKELIEQNAALSFEKQLILAEVIGSSAWQLDMEKGNISFGDLEFPIQIIGSLAFNTSSWMWGWANIQSGMPENLLIQSNQLKIIGLEKNIKELEEGHFSVEEGFEHKIGMMACGLFESKSYYCANYGQGTLVVTMDDNKIPAVDQSRFEKVLTSFPQLISSVEINHKNAFQNYLIDSGFKLHISGNKIEGMKNNNILLAEFDGQDRLKSLNGEL